MLEFCADHHLPVLMRIPFERTIAQGIAEGKTLPEIDPAYGNRLRTVFNQIQHIHTASGQAVLS
jgi:MinD superfamily P-loop ATPase